MIDRNARARLAVRIRQDKRLSPITRHVGNAALFATTDARTGRCQAYRARLAHEAGCSERSVTRATHALEETGYIKVVPTYEKRRLANGRWFRPRGANVIEWQVSADFFLSAKMAAYPSLKIIKEAQAPLPESLVRILERLGTAIADKAELLKVPIDT